MEKLLKSTLIINITDVETTYEVYEALIKELEVYQIHIPPTKIYSLLQLENMLLSN